jgi:Mg2+/Co2+ transporter CorB
MFALVILIIISGFFSGSETGLMTLNRYRLRHLARHKHAGAMRAEKLLRRPDRLIGLILLGNNFVNILATSLATYTALRIVSEYQLSVGVEVTISVTSGILTFIILIFAEVTPKTLAALHSEKYAFPASLVLTPLLKVLYPFVWITNVIANGLMRLLGVRGEDAPTDSLSSEELRTVVNEAGAMIPRGHQQMLLNILDLERVTVDDIMVPRNEIMGIDLEEEWDEIVDELQTCEHTRMPVYLGEINNVQGIVHMRNVLPVLTSSDAPESVAREKFLDILREPYFVPEGTSLTKQMLNFQHEKRRIALVVDEYGDIQGLVTLEDILEEIVGEFTTDPAARLRDIHPQDDGSFLVDGSTSIRELNRQLDIALPTDGPKTLNGLILEHLESIPEAGTSLLLANYPVEIMQTKENTVKIARLLPALVASEEEEKTTENQPDIM